MKGLRAKSDHLWRLCRMISGMLMVRIKSFQGIYKKNAQHLSLIDFYTKQDVWRREDERKEFENEENLAALKHRATHAMIRAIGAVGTFPHDDVTRLIQDIRVQLHYACFPEILETLDQARALCRKRDLFFQWQEVLSLEIAAMSRSLPPNDLATRLTLIQQETEEVHQKIADIQRFTDVTLRFKAPLKAALEHDSTWDKNLAATYIQHPAMTDETNCLSTRSKFLFHEHWMFAMSSQPTKEVSLAHGHQLLQLYQTHPWLQSEDTDQYANFIMRMVGYACEDNDQVLATTMLQMLQQLDHHDPRIAAIAIDKLLFSYFWLAKAFGNQTLGDQACQILQTNKTTLKTRLMPLHYAWLLFCAASHELSRTKYNPSLDYLEEIIQRKAEVKIDLQAHCRTMMVLCWYGLNRDTGFLEDACRSAKRFLAKQTIDTQVQTCMLTGLEAAVKIGFHDSQPVGNTIYLAWQKTANRLADLRDSGVHEIAFDYFDYQAWWEKRKPAKTSPES